MAHSNTPAGPHSSEHSSGDAVDGGRDGIRVLGDGGGDAGVLCVHGGDEFTGREEVEVRVSLVDSFRRQLREDGVQGWRI